MKNVGIMSMQRIANYGSSLQAYGLKKILEEMGCNVQFVDYHPGKTLIPSNEGVGIKRKVKKVLDVLKCNAPFNEKIKYIKYKKNYAKKNNHYLGITDTLNYYPQLDVLVIGSDEVFNCVQCNANIGFSAELFGVGSKAKKTVTYAASFGNTKLDLLKKYEVDEKIATWLKDLDFISVRDYNSGYIVKKLINKEPKFNLDPVLVYEFLEKCSLPSINEDNRYLVLYGYPGRFNREECNFIREYAKKMELKVFCIGGIQDVCDKYIDCDMFQVIEYFKHAECVITDTFHGSILSMITHKQFVTIVRRNGYGNSEKIEDLLCRMNLCNRVINAPNELEKKIDEEIDFESVDRIITQERKEARQYLTACLS